MRLPSYQLNRFLCSSSSPLRLTLPRTATKTTTTEVGYCRHLKWKASLPSIGARKWFNQREMKKKMFVLCATSASNSTLPLARRPFETMYSFLCTPFFANQCYFFPVAFCCGFFHFVPTSTATPPIERSTKYIFHAICRARAPVRKEFNLFPTPPSHLVVPLPTKRTELLLSKTAYPLFSLSHGKFEIWLWLWLRLCHGNIAGTDAIVSLCYGTVTALGLLAWQFSKRACFCTFYALFLSQTGYAFKLRMRVCVDTI